MLVAGDETEVNEVKWGERMESLSGGQKASYMALFTRCVYVCVCGGGGVRAACVVCCYVCYVSAVYVCMYIECMCVFLRMCELIS